MLIILLLVMFVMLMLMMPPADIYAATVNAVVNFDAISVAARTLFGCCIYYTAARCYVY